MEAYFRTTSYALVISAFLSIALTGELDALSTSLYSIAILLCYYRDVKDVHWLRPKEWVWRALSIGYVPFVFVDAGLISNRVLALVHMTLFVSAAKLFQTKRDRDWVFLYLIAFFQVLLSAGLTFDATFVGSLMVFLFFFISTLAAFEIRRAGREVSLLEEETITPLKQQRIKYRTTPTVKKKTRRVRYLLGASLAQIVIVVALALPLFFLIPRLSGGGMAGGVGEGQTITGFSEHVQLGEVASIKKSARVAMRVRLDHRPDRYLRWRGIAFDAYDGRGWSVSRYNNDNRFITYTNGGAGVEAATVNQQIWWRYALSQDTSRQPVFFQQRFVLEALETNTLFAAQQARILQGPMTNIQLDRQTGALSSVGLKGRTTYVVKSDVSVPNEQELDRDIPAQAPDKIRELYLQLPRKYPRIAAKAHEITQNAPRPYQKAKAIESFLKTDFHYTLDLKTAGDDPLSEFLFETHEGHCEYFATAMAIMLRTLDIPARVVNGFQMGEYNELNDMYTVRESDAHSWVEAYFPKTDSWVEFDPTPAAGINDYSRGGLMARLRKYTDALEVFWLDYVVTLDSDEQASIMVDLQHRLLSVKDRLLNWYNGVKQWTREKMTVWFVSRKWTIGDFLRIIAAILIAAALTAASLVALSRRKHKGIASIGYGPWWHRLFILPMWRRQIKNRDYRQSAVLFYEQMLSISKRAGLVKQPHETPFEFAEASGLAPIREITSLYNRVRFGGARLDAGETRLIADLLAELKRSVKQNRH